MLLKLVQVCFGQKTLETATYAPYVSAYMISAFSGV
jgi:hypothetical protein